MNLRVVLCLALPAIVAAQQPAAPPSELPPVATTQLARSLEAAEPHAAHLWRDTPPLNPDGTLNGYVEIARGDRRKWEYDMARNLRAIDRVMPEDAGGYPVNYGFVPQTVSYDGDPFDVLVLGPPIPGGRLVRGVIIGLMRMEDEKGLDSKVVISLVDRAGRGNGRHAGQRARAAGRPANGRSSGGHGDANRRHRDAADDARADRQFDPSPRGRSR